MGNDGLKGIREDINKIDCRVSKIEELWHSIDKQLPLDKMELSNLITKAVSDGNRETLKVIDGIYYYKNNKDGLWYKKRE